MDRVLEPELMDNERQSIAYAKADFSASNQHFVDGLIRDFPGHLHRAVDIGCGPVTSSSGLPGRLLTFTSRRSMARRQ